MTELTSKNYDEIVASEKLLLIDFGATWCGPCKKIAPFVEQCFDKLSGVKLVYVDSDLGFDVYNSLKIKSLPTTYSFVEGLPYEVVVGANENELADLFLKMAQRIYNEEMEN